MDIAAPKLPPDHPDHLIECEFVLEPAIQALAEEAERAGWEPYAICVAIARLGGARSEMIDANAATDADIATARLPS